MNETNRSVKKDDMSFKQGLSLGIAAYVLWGLLPLYWKTLDEISPFYILVNRIFWSFCFSIILMIIFKRQSTIMSIVKDKKKFVLISIAGIVISLNWYLYIWAVNSGRVLDASLGYYINPLVVMIFSVIIFKEKIGKWQVISIIFATVGVLYMVIQYGQFPYMALGLAVTFALYGAIKKFVNIDPISSLTLETAIFIPVAIIIMVMTESNGGGVIAYNDPMKIILVMASGLFTVIPLILYSYSTNSIPLSVVGFLQYISPTMSFFFGVFLYKEPFSTGQLVSFIFIWIALIIFTLAKIGILRDAQKEKSV